jgi:hypothetical protein
MRAYLTCAVGAASVVAAAFAPAMAADNLNSVVRTLNAVLNPEDARRYEDQARRNHRPEEERYWHNYGAGLEQQRGGGPGFRGDNGPGPGPGGRPGPGPSAGPGPGRIGPEEAARLEDRARREGHWDEARYWASYRAGLQGRR